MSPRIPPFWLACYSQPYETLPKWWGRGCNIAVKAELRNGTVDQKLWRQKCREAGLPYVDTFIDASDADDPWLMGWILTDSDEWNRRYKALMDTGKADQANALILRLQDEAVKLAALNKAKGTAKWIMANADGMACTAAYGAYDGLKNQERALLPLLTMRCSDWYPVVNTKPGEEARRPMWLPAQAVERTQTWGGMKMPTDPEPMYAAFIEGAKGWNSPLSITGDQMFQICNYLMGKSFPGPRPNSEMTLSGVKMFILWSANGQSGPGWKWDAMNDEQVTAWKAICNKMDPQHPAWTSGPVTPSPADDTAARLKKLEDLAASQADAIGAMMKRLDAVEGTANRASQLLNVQGQQIGALQRVINSIGKAAVVEG